MRRGAAVVGVVALLLLGGCTGGGVGDASPASAPSGPTVSVPAVTAATTPPAELSPPPEPTGPAALPGVGAVPMTDRELVLARALAVGDGPSFPPSTCGVVRVAEAGEDIYGWAFCTFRYPGLDEDSATSGVFGLRGGRLWAPQEGARHQADVVEALGEERARWVLDHEAELADRAQARHG